MIAGNLVATFGVRVTQNLPKLFAPVIDVVRQICAASLDRRAVLPIEMVISVP
jgi:hypothetical protein